MSAHADLPHPGCTVFLYQRMVNAWLEREGEPTTVVYGGRGFGKSVFLYAVQAQSESPRAEREHPPIIEGRDHSDAPLALERYVAEGGNEHLLIDDVDHLAHIPDAPVLSSVRRNLELAIRLARVQKRRCMVTSTVPLPQTFVEDDPLSYLFMQFHPRALQPWLEGWEATLSKALRAQLAGQKPPRWIDLGAGTFACDRALITAWEASTRELAGGHPTLVGRSVEAFRENLVPPGSGRGRGGAELVPRFLEHRLARALSPIRKRISELRDHSLDDRHAAYAALRRLAAAGGAGTELSYVEAEILSQEGLAFTTDKDLTWRIPGSMIQTEVLRADGSGTELRAAVPLAEPPAPTGPVALELLEDPDGDAAGGRVVVRSAAGRAEVRLPRRQWRIVRLLHARDGGVVSVPDLCAASDTPSRAALGSALQHINDKLSKAGAAGVFENVWGAGYRLGDHVSAK
jgi:hypothetical protein